MCFCQVRFQGSARRTAAQEGPSPTWNESLFLPFVPPRKDFSPSNLQSISDNVWFNLFDEVVVEAVPEDYRNEDAMFQRRERRYLGSFATPALAQQAIDKLDSAARPPPTAQRGPGGGVDAPDDDAIRTPSATSLASHQLSVLALGSPSYALRHPFRPRLQSRAIIHHE